MITTIESKIPKFLNSSSSSSNKEPLGTTHSFHVSSPKVRKKRTIKEFLPQEEHDFQLLKLDRGYVPPTHPSRKRIKQMKHLPSYEQSAGIDQESIGMDQANHSLHHQKSHLENAVESENQAEYDPEVSRTNLDFQHHPDNYHVQAQDKPAHSDEGAKLSKDEAYEEEETCVMEGTTVVRKPPRIETKNEHIDFYFDTTPSGEQQQSEATSDAHHSNTPVSADRTDPAKVVLQEHYIIEENNPNTPLPVAPEFYHLSAGSRLFVGNLELNYEDKEELTSVFGKYGAILDISFKNMSRSTHGYIQFDNVESCQKARVTEDRKEMKGGFKLGMH